MKKQELKMKNLILLILLGTSISFSQITMTKNTDPSNPINGFASNPTYRGAAWVDIDNDNDLDLFAAPGFIFKNKGNDVFIQESTDIGSGQTQNASGSTWADFDNDGDIDCFLARNPSRLYINNGSGVFEEYEAAY